jgi:hypothetical protein
VGADEGIEAVEPAEDRCRIVVDVDAVNGLARGFERLHRCGADPAAEPVTTVVVMLTR